MGWYTLAPLGSFFGLVAPDESTFKLSLPFDHRETLTLTTSPPFKLVAHSSVDEDAVAAMNVRRNDFHILQFLRVFSEGHRSADWDRGGR